MTRQNTTVYVADNTTHADELSTERVTCERCGCEGWRGDFPCQGGIVSGLCDECADESDTGPDSDSGSALYVELDVDGERIMYSCDDSEDSAGSLHALAPAGYALHLENAVQSDLVDPAGRPIWIAPLSLACNDCLGGECCSCVGLDFDGGCSCSCLGTSQAALVAGLFGWDGQRLELPNGLEIGEICQQRGARLQYNANDTGDAYKFLDDSVLLVIGRAWDLGFDGCLCWRSAGHSDSCQQSEND